MGSGSAMSEAPGFLGLSSLAVGWVWSWIFFKCLMQVRLQMLRVFFQWLSRQNVVLANPAADLELPRVPKKLPKAILTEREVERVLAIPDVTDPTGLRDRVMMDVLYSTGLRHRHRAAPVRAVDSGWWGRAWRLEEIKELLGHKDISIPQRYAHLAKGALLTAADETDRLRAAVLASDDTEAELPVTFAAATPTLRLVKPK